MKYVVDKVTGDLCEKPEQQPTFVQPLPIPEGLLEFEEFMSDLKDKMNRVFGGVRD